MNIEKINQILEDTAYIRSPGSEEEKRCAEYLHQQCALLGLETREEAFALDLARIQEASLLVDGREIPCKGYLCSGSGDVEAELIYLSNTDPYSLRLCRGKIVLLDGALRGWTYRDILSAGALGFISYEGDLRYGDADIDQKELRYYLRSENRIPGVHIHARDAVDIVRSGAGRARICLRQEEYTAQSRNVILELPGEVDEWIVFTAHYDTTPLSVGAYDNMSGCISLLMLAEEFSACRHRRGIRFIWCGCEEWGLLGSRAYCAAHEKELEKVILNINLDMIGCLMGKFVVRCIAEEKLVHYIQYLAAELGKGAEVVQSISSTDCACFADKGVPAVSFFRFAPPNTATIHNRYDTREHMSAEQLTEDISFVAAFARRMANAVHGPVAHEIPPNLKEKLDYYFFRKRDPSLR